MGCIFHPELAVRMNLLIKICLAMLVQTIRSRPLAMHGAKHIACTQVTSCHIIKHRDTQKPRGCFVEFETREDLEKALLKDGTVRTSKHL